MGTLGEDPTNKARNTKALPQNEDPQYRFDHEPSPKDLSGTWLISDLHLCPEKPLVCAAVWRFFSALAKHATASPSSIPALYLLGDIFEAWIGDDDKNALSLEFSAHCTLLARLGVNIFLQHGNRDFLMGKDFAKQCNAVLLPQTYLASINGENTLLIHGDELCTDDVEYQRLRTQLRSSQWQQNFLAQDLAQRKIQAQQYREASKAAQMAKTASIMDVNEDTTMQTMLSHGVSRLIHGHTHRPKIHRYASSTNAPFRFRCVLGDWDSSAYGLCIRDANILLKKWSINDSIYQAQCIDHQPWHHTSMNASAGATVATDT